MGNHLARYYIVRVHRKTMILNEILDSTLLVKDLTVNTRVGTACCLFASILPTSLYLVAKSTLLNCEFCIANLSS
jgi:hypothetical protein